MTQFTAFGTTKSKVPKLKELVEHERQDGHRR